jgi:hypothetical protein
MIIMPCRSERLVSAFAGSDGIPSRSSTLLMVAPNLGGGTGRMIGSRTISPRTIDGAAAPTLLKREQEPEAFRYPLRHGPYIVLGWTSQIRPATGTPTNEQEGANAEL